MINLDERLTSAASAVRQRVDPVAPPLAQLVRRSRRRRVGVVVAVALLGGVAIASWAVSDDAGRSVQISPAQSAEPTGPTSLPDDQGAILSPSEQLFLGPFSVAVAFRDGGRVHPTSLSWTRTILGQDADGALRVLPVQVPEQLVVHEARRFPDGRVVVLGSEDLEPGVSREDGPNVADVAFPLVVFSPDGTISSQHDVRIVGENVRLLGTNDDDIVLARSSPGSTGAASIRVVAFAPDTGVERPLGEVDQFPDTADVAGSRLLLAGTRRPTADTSDAGPLCRLEGVDLTSALTVTYQAPGFCAGVSGARLSRDGSSAAIVYQSLSGRSNELRVAVFDFGSGALRHDELLGYNIPYGDAFSCASGCPDGSAVDYAGMAWDDDGNSVRVAAVEHPADNNPEAVSLPSAIHVVTVPSTP